MKTILFLIIAMLVLMLTTSAKPRKEIVDKSIKDTIRLSQANEEALIQITGIKGKSFNHPSFAIWLEDTSGNYIQDIYVTKYVSNGIFGHGYVKNGKWEKGQRLLPAALPVWMHKRVSKSGAKPLPPSPESPVVDAYTGATPKNNFIVETQLPSDISQKLKVYLELNQTWDWNDYWTNNKFPEDADYKTSSQPALVYCVTIDLNTSEAKNFELLGHSHYSGKDGSINPDISTITTAKEILLQLSIQIIK